MSSERDKERERARYAALTPEQKREKGRLANQRKQARLESVRKLERQNYMLRRAARDRHRKRYGNEPLVDLTPFRMWLLGKQRQHGGTSSLARVLGMDESRLRAFLRGYSFEDPGLGAPDWCGPVPIISVSIEVVDRCLTNEGSIRLDDLYPHVEGWDET